MNRPYPETFVIFVSFVVRYSSDLVAAMPRWVSVVNETQSWVGALPRAG